MNDIYEANEIHPETKEKHYWEHMGMMDNPLGMGQITRVLEEKFGMQKSCQQFDTKHNVNNNEK